MKIPFKTFLTEYFLANILSSSLSSHFIRSKLKMPAFQANSLIITLRTTNWTGFRKRLTVSNSITINSSSRARNTHLILIRLSKTLTRRTRILEIQTTCTILSTMNTNIMSFKILSRRLLPVFIRLAGKECRLELRTLLFNDSISLRFVFSTQVSISSLNSCRHIIT